jgi:hypothetical protein
MRAFVLFLALLVALKIWVQDSVYRAATQEALVAAYRARAAQACAASTSAASAPAGGTAIDWLKDDDARVAIGKPSVPVHFWQLDSDLWEARFRQPYLLLSGGNGLSCAYDLLGDTAEVLRSS